MQEEEQKALNIGMKDVLSCVGEERFWQYMKRGRIGLMRRD